MIQVNWTLYQGGEYEADIDPSDLLGTVSLHVGGQVLTLETIYLDTWLNAFSSSLCELLSGAVQLEKDVYDEPDKIEFLRDGNDVHISFAGQRIEKVPLIELIRATSQSCKKLIEVVRVECPKKEISSLNWIDDFVASVEPETGIIAAL